MTIVKEVLALKLDLEGRLDRLAVTLDERFHTLREEVIATIAANDVRYQQRFDAQSKALDFAAAAAKEAVANALAGADKAAIKTEQTADKRFADLGDLIREQFKGMTNTLEGIVARVSILENRLNESFGAKMNEQRTQDTTGRWWIIGLGVAGWLTALASFALHAYNGK